MAKPSQKGSNFERKVCTILSKWWTEGERDDIFWRSSTSGARAKTRSKSGKQTFGQYGDVQATDPIGQSLLNTVVIELKNGYKRFCVLDSLDKPEKGAKQVFESFVEQVEEDRQNAGVPYFLLITKRDQRVPVVFMPRKLYLELHDFFGKPKMEYFPVALSIGIYDQVLMGMRFTDWLNWVHPDFFRKKGTTK